MFSLNRALKYGDGVFETIRIKAGKPCYLENHFNRLIGSLAQLKIELNQLQLNEIKVCIDQLLIKNELESNAKLRLTVFRDGGGTYKPTASKAAYFIEAEQLDEAIVHLNQNGLRIDFSEEVTIFPNYLTSIKTLNSLPYILAAIEAKERKLDDLILLNNHQGLAEATSSNIFLVKKQDIYTPPISEGCLDGVMRSKVIEIAKKLDFKIVEIPLKKEALLVADEIFLSNSVKKIQWVGSFGKKRYFNKVSKQLFESIY
ncbi:MAG: aminotransferase class IV [Vicingaceae bacterium]